METAQLISRKYTVHITDKIDSSTIDREIWEPFTYWLQSMKTTIPHGFSSWIEPINKACFQWEFETVKQITAADEIFIGLVRRLSYELHVDIKTS